MQKDFDSWCAFQKKLEFTHNPPFFKEGEIWWSSIGVNIGYEMCGKGKIYARPVIVIKKYNHFTFLGVPTTSSYRNKPWSYTVSFSDRESDALLNQGRIFDSRRLANKITQLPDKTFMSLKEAFLQYQK